MNGTFLELLGIFLGGALPWLEAVVVIPVGIAAGLPPVAVVVAGASGNLVTVAGAAFFGDRARRWWQRRQQARGIEPGERSQSRRSRWLSRVVDRWGLTGLAVLGPLGLGTQVSAVVAIGLGHSARKSFTWIATGTVCWCIAAGLLASSGLRLVGIGAS